ncbi:hypothetical protein [Streptomyces sp. NPDC005181]|uniref:hypothetical protein n=1 Tax=Streptomyces sp. NPDC005181 TaxID=3156869 RepID=UPI0033AA6E43
MAQDPCVVSPHPVLSRAILKAASAQLRNLTTIGGNPVRRTRCRDSRRVWSGWCRPTSTRRTSRPVEPVNSTEPRPATWRRMSA